MNYSFQGTLKIRILSEAADNNFVHYSLKMVNINLIVIGGNLVRSTELIHFVVIMSQFMIGPTQFLPIAGRIMFTLFKGDPGMLQSTPLGSGAERPIRPFISAIDGPDLKPSNERSKFLCTRIRSKPSVPKQEVRWAARQPLLGSISQSL